MVEIEIYYMLETDLEFFCTVRNSCAEKFLHDSRKFSLLESVQWYREKSPEFYIIKVNGERAGYFRTSNLNLEEGSIYIGCDLHEDFRGRGIAYQSYLFFIPFISKKYKISKINLEVLSTNTLAINLYNKLGFSKIGVKEKSILKNGVMIDSIIMEINTNYKNGE